MMLPSSKSIPFDAEINSIPVVRNSEVDSSVASIVDDDQVDCEAATREEDSESDDYDSDDYRELRRANSVEKRSFFGNPFRFLQGYKLLPNRVSTTATATTAIPINNIAFKQRSVTAIRTTRMRITLLTTLFILLVLTVYVHANWRTGQGNLFRQQWSVSQMSDNTKKLICQMTNETLFKEIVRPLLVPRIVGTQEHKQAANYIAISVENAGFTVEYDRFVEDTPHGNKQFKNIIATFDPTAPRRLVLACHYESKIFPGANFIGATDSAVPCAMLLDIARTLGPYLKNRLNKEVTLQLLFLDGEEAFSEWTETDSLYGARHLSKKWHEKKYAHPNDPTSVLKSELDRIDVFVLLDLLGAPNPQIRNYHHLLAEQLFEYLPSTELELHRLNCLQHLPYIFVPGKSWAAVEDDHIPFRRRGVPILHIIPVPFPTVWHELTDNESALHYPTIDNILSILRVFTAKYLDVVP